MLHNDRQLTAAGLGAAFFFPPREKVMVGAENAAAELAKARTEAAASFILTKFGLEYDM